MFTILHYNQTEEKLTGKFDNSPTIYIYSGVSEFMYRKLRTLLEKRNNKAASGLLKSFGKVDKAIESMDNGVFSKEIKEITEEFGDPVYARKAVGYFYQGVTAFATQLMKMMEDPEAEAEDLTQMLDRVHEEMQMALILFGDKDKMGSG